MLHLANTMKVYMIIKLDEKEASSLPSTTLVCKQEFFNTKDGKKGSRKEDFEHSGINNVCWAGFNDNQDQFAYVDESGSITLWDLKKRIQLSEKGVSTSILTACALEQVNTRLLACGGLDTRICVFSINRKEELGKITKVKDLTDHTGMITCCSFLDENYLISGSNDSTILLWDISRTGRSIRQFMDHESEVVCLDICEEDGNLIASGSGDTTLRLWDIRMKDACMRVFDVSKHSTNSVKFMPGR